MSCTLAKSRHYPTPPRVELGRKQWSPREYRRYLKFEGKKKVARACPFVLDDGPAALLRLHRRISSRGLVGYECSTKDCNCCCYYLDGNVTSLHSSIRPHRYDPLDEGGTGCAHRLGLQPHENPEGLGWRQVSTGPDGTRWLCRRCVKRPPAPPTLHRATRKKGTPK